MPTLVLCGRHDPQYPIACSQELAASILSAHLIVFERSGHYPFIEEGEAFWRTVDEFLAQRSSGFDTIWKEERTPLGPTYRYLKSFCAAHPRLNAGG